ncbi:MAG: hypothetical protein ACOCZI_01520 [Marinilabiliaceae bacterium]
MRQKQGIVEVTPPVTYPIDDFLEQLMERDICYRAGTLRNRGFDLNEEIYDAVSRAMQIMGRSGYPLRQHFKKIYVWDESTGAVQPDWKLSRMAMALTVLNGPVDNPFVSRTQLALLKRYINV